MSLHVPVYSVMFLSILSYLSVLSLHIPVFSVSPCSTLFCHSMFQFCHSMFQSILSLHVLVYSVTPCSSLFCHSMLQSILTIGDALLKDGNAWANMSVSQQRSTAATLLDSMETTGLLAASTMDIGASNTTRRANIGQCTLQLPQLPCLTQTCGRGMV